MSMIRTKRWLADQPASLQEAAAAIAEGGIVAFPTETVYGLGANARKGDAVRRIFEAKGRPADNPLIVHLASAEDLPELTAGPVSDVEERLIRAFWPGPLTLVVPVKPGAVSPLVTAGLDTVAVRVPAHDLARRLIALAGCPVAAPSANRSGRPSPTSAAHVLEDLDGRIDGVLDGGPAGVGLESTVVRVLGDEIHVLRPGGVTAEALQEAAGPSARVVTAGSREPAEEDDAAGSAQGAPRSPGMKYAHYAPQGEMLLVVSEDPQRMIGEVRRLAASARSSGRRVGIIACAEHADQYAGAADEVLVCGSRREPESAARQLYAVLRECDRRNLAFIVAEGFPETGIGAALMNRLRKAAGGRVLAV